MWMWLELNEKVNEMCMVMSLEIWMEMLVEVNKKMNGLWMEM